MGAADNKSLLRIINVLDCFNGKKLKLSVLEISNMTLLPYSTAGRLLQNLLSVGLLNQDEKTKEYYLGAKVLSWAGSYLNKMDLLEISQSFLVDLQQKTKETISLYVLDHFERICIFRKESSHSVRMVARIGERMSLHLGAAGKFFLLQLSENEKTQYFNEQELSELDVKILETSLFEISKNGYSTSFGERVAEAASVAAPIYNLQKRIIAVINISGPIQRFDEITIQEFTKLILNTSKQISHELGFIGEK